MKRSFARTISSPRWIRIDGGVARDVEHDRASTFARRSRQRAHQRLRQSERPEDVCGKDTLEIFALRVRQHGQWCWSKIGSVVDQHVKTTEFTGDLHSDRIDVLFG